MSWILFLISLNGLYMLSRGTSLTQEDGEHVDLVDLQQRIVFSDARTELMMVEFEEFKMEIREQIEILKIQLQTCISNTDYVSDNVPLRFHSVHGENIEMSVNRTLIKRSRGYGKGYAFSNRPLKANEKIKIRVLETETVWKGDLIVGFTKQNPINLTQMMPLSDSHFVRNMGANTITSIDENPLVDLIEINSIIELTVTEQGDVNCLVDGQDMGIILKGIDTLFPFWLVLDVYGRTSSIELVNSESIAEHNNREIQVSPMVTVGSNGIWSLRNTDTRKNEDRPRFFYPVHDVVNNGPTDVTQRPLDGFQSISTFRSTSVNRTAKRKQNSTVTNRIQNGPPLWFLPYGVSSVQ